MTDASLNEVASKLSSCNGPGGQLHDPEKIWAILHYPDSVRVTAGMLEGLLTALSNYSDDDVRMNEFQWTLTARINSLNESYETPVGTADPLDGSDNDEWCGIPGGNATSNSRLNIATSGLGYFSKTSKVASPSDNSSTCHDSVLVDLRYMFHRVDKCIDGKTPRELMEDIAAAVRVIVTDKLNLSNSSCKVYVLKPQYQTAYGVSPLCLTPRKHPEATESFGFPVDNI